MDLKKKNIMKGKKKFENERCNEYYKFCIFIPLEFEFITLWSGGTAS